MKKLFVFLALSFVSIGVLANTMTPPGSDSHWVYYAYGNAKAVGAFLDALTRIVGTASFKSLLIAIAVGGFAASGAAGMISGNPTKFFGYIIGLMLLVYSIFGINANIYVKEMVYAPGTIGEFVVVEKVPAAIAIPMVVISKVGSGITDLFNQHLTTPEGEDLIVEGGSLPFGAGMGIAKDMANVRIANPYLSKNFNEWVAKCLAPRVFSGDINMADVASSTDLLATLRTTRAATSGTQFFRMTHLDGSLGGSTTHDPDGYIQQNGGIVSCSEGFKVIEKQLKSEVNGSMEEIGKKISPMMAGAVLSADKVGAIATKVAGSSVGTATNLATQGAIISLLQGSSAYQAQVLENDAALLALNLNNAQRSQKTGWYTASVLFRDMGGYFFAILQVFLIGVTPLILVLMFIPGMGAKLGGSYIKACIWLASWWPSLQIVNFVMEIYYQSSAATTFGTGGLTMVNSGLANHFSDNMIIAAGFMATLVPTVMWGIINGAGYALTSVLDRAAGGSYASSAAQDSAAGNFRAGNVGMNSFSANKFDNSIAYATGTRAAEAYNGASSMSSIEELGGRGATANNSLVSTQYSEAATQNLKAARANEEQASTAFNTQLAATSKQAISTLEQLSENATFGEKGVWQFSNKEDYDKATQAMGALKDSYAMAVANGYTSDFQTYAGVEGKFDASLTGILGSGVKFSGGAKGSDTETDSVKFTETKDGSITLTDSQNNKIVDSQSLQHTIDNGLSTTGISTQSYAQTKELTELHAKSEAYQKAQKETLSAETAVTQSLTTTVANATDSQTWALANENQYKANLPKEKDNLESRAVELNDPVDSSLKGGVEGALGEPLAIEDGNGNVVNAETIAAGVDNVKAEAGEKADAAKQQTTDSYAKAKQENFESRLDMLNDKNKEVVNEFLVKHESAVADRSGSRARRFNEGGEGEEILSKADNWGVDGQVFVMSGLVANKESEGGYDLVYRTGSNANDYQYYAVDDHGKARELKVEQEEGEGAYYAGYQVDSLSEYTDRVGEGSQHQGDRKGQGEFRSGTEFSNINPENLGNKPYVALDAGAVSGLGGTGGSHTGEELAANSNTDIDRASSPMAGVMSVKSTEDMRLYDLNISSVATENSNSGFARFQERYSADWSGDDYPTSTGAEAYAADLLSGNRNASILDAPPTSRASNEADVSSEPITQPEQEPGVTPQAQPTQGQEVATQTQPTQGQEVTPQAQAPQEQEVTPQAQPTQEVTTQTQAEQAVTPQAQPEQEVAVDVSNEPVTQPTQAQQEPQLNAAGNVAGTFHPPRNPDPEGSTSVDIPAGFNAATTVLPVVNDYFQAEHGRNVSPQEWQQARYEIALENPELNNGNISRTVEVSNELLSRVANKEE